MIIKNLKGMSVLMAVGIASCSEPQVTVIQEIGPNSSGCMAIVERVNHHATVDYVYVVYLEAEIREKRQRVLRLIDLDPEKLNVKWEVDEELIIRYPRSADELDKSVGNDVSEMPECRDVRVRFKRY